MYKRNQYEILKARISEKRRFIQVISGPRQVGKTTLVKQFLADSNHLHHFVSADAVQQTNSIWIEQQWEIARLMLSRSQEQELWLIIDEIQKIENWSEVVKRHWDQDTWDNINIKLILLGSSRLLLQQGLTESLAGRFELIPMAHWSLKEMEEAFGFTADQYVWFGGYPGAVSLIQDEQRWKNYIRDALVETTISKDILMLSSIRKPALLRNVFELSCAYSGQILSYTKMLGKLHEAGNTTTLSHYLNLLDSAGLVTGLEKVYKKPIHSRASSPKLQVLNTAFMAIYSSLSFEQVRQHPETWGRHVESTIGAHLANASRQSSIDLLYWRDGNSEVDFVLKKQEKLIGIEVKSGNRKHAPGMQAFSHKFSPHKLLLIGTGGLPWQDFLTIDPIDLF